MGNLVIHGGSVQNTIPSSSERYVVAQASIKDNISAVLELNNRKLDPKPVFLHYQYNYIISPNINLETLLQNVRYFYIDMVIVNENVQYKINAKTFNDNMELAGFISSNYPNIQLLSLTFYMLKNNTENLNISGFNFMLTKYTRDMIGARAKISNKSTFWLQTGDGNMTVANSQLLSLFNAESINSLFIFGNNNIEGFSSIINNECMYHLSTINKAIKIMNFNRYGKRKLSGFNVNFKGCNTLDNNTTEMTQVSTDHSKLLCTFLCSYSYTDLSITIICASTPYKPVGFIANGIQTSNNQGYFHVYIFETNKQSASSASSFRNIAIEFLSVDGIQMPASFDNSSSIGFNMNNNPPILYKSNSGIIFQNTGPYSAVRGIDRNNNLSVPLAELIQFRKSNKFCDNKVDVIRIYDNKTCDVFSKALSIENVKHLVNGHTSGAYFFKLNN